MIGSAIIMIMTTTLITVTNTAFIKTATATTRQKISIVIDEYFYL